MLGHKLYQVLNPVFEVKGTIRGHLVDITRCDLFQPSQIIPQVDAMKSEKLEQVVAWAKPEVVINCIGVIKPLVEKVGISAATRLNAEGPYEVYRICREKDIRLL